MSKTSTHSSVDYDSVANTYDRRYDNNDYSGIEAALGAFMGPTHDGRVLEVGCGTGHWLRLLGARGIRAAGLDVSARSRRLEDELFARGYAHPSTLGSQAHVTASPDGTTSDQQAVSACPAVR